MGRFAEEGLRRGFPRGCVVPHYTSLAEILSWSQLRLLVFALFTLSRLVKRNLLTPQGTEAPTPTHTHRFTGFEIARKAFPTFYQHSSLPAVGLPAEQRISEEQKET